MAADGILDLDLLLAPISGGAGSDPRDTRPFEELLIALDDARDLEKRRDQPFDEDDRESMQAFAEATARLPDAWRKVRRAAEAVIARSGKEFEAATLLVESLVRLEGLAGLAAGARLLTGLVEQYWDSGFPVIDEDGLDRRSSRIGRLAGQGDEDEPRTGSGGVLLAPLRRLPLFSAADGTDRALWTYTRRDGGLDLEKLAAEGRQDARSLQQAGREAADALAAWHGFEASLQGRFPAELAPPTRRVAQVLERIITAASPFAAPPVVQPGPGVSAAHVAQTAPAAARPAAAGDGGMTLTADGAIATREDALRQLQGIAEYFRRTEPHSPLSYTLDHAVRRARMSLPNLLAEVMTDATIRDAVLIALGIQPVVDGQDGGGA